MKTIILAAGISQRLRPLTNKIPKCLIKIDDCTILERTIENCVKNKLQDIIVVIGHGHDYVKQELGKLKEKYSIDLGLIFNKHYEDMNNCYSLYLGIKEMEESIIVINSDDVFDDRILTNLCKEDKTSLVIDNVKNLTEESMKIYYNDSITDINKKLNIKKSYGEYIGLAKIDKQNIDLLKYSLDKVVKENPDLYYEDAFQLMFNQTNFKVCNTDGLKWTEVDTPKDLEIAKKLIKTNFK